jgi:hypothetical protein
MRRSAKSGSVISCVSATVVSAHNETPSPSQTSQRRHENAPPPAPCSRRRAALARHALGLEEDSDRRMAARPVVLPARRIHGRRDCGRRRRGRTRIASAFRQWPQGVNEGLIDFKHGADFAVAR